MTASRVVRVRWGQGDAHELLRRVVAGAADRAVEDVAIGHAACPRCGGPHGRPVALVGGQPGPSVSLARAGGLAVVAVAPAGRGVGVDVEVVADRSDVAVVALAPAERRALADRPAAQPGASTLRTWVRKEAVLKALGHGLLVDPALVALREPGGARSAVARWDGPGRRPAVRLADLGDDAVPGHVVAVAREGRRRFEVDLAPWSGSAP